MDEGIYVYDFNDEIGAALRYNDLNKYIDYRPLDCLERFEQVQPARGNKLLIYHLGNGTVPEHRVVLERARMRDNVFVASYGALLAEWPFDFHIGAENIYKGRALLKHLAKMFPRIPSGVYA